MEFGSGKAEGGKNETKIKWNSEVGRRKVERMKQKSNGRRKWEGGRRKAEYGRRKNIELLTCILT
jgi:hypothetical protein